MLETANNKRIEKDIRIINGKRYLFHNFQIIKSLKMDWLCSVTNHPCPDCNTSMKIREAYIISQILKVELMKKFLQCECGNIIDLLEEIE